MDKAEDNEKIALEVELVKKRLQTTIQRLRTAIELNNSRQHRRNQNNEDVNAVTDFKKELETCLDLLHQKALGTIQKMHNEADERTESKNAELQEQLNLAEAVRIKLDKCVQNTDDKNLYIKVANNIVADSDSIPQFLDASLVKFEFKRNRKLLESIQSETSLGTISMLTNNTLDSECDAAKSSLFTREPVESPYTVVCKETLVVKSSDEEESYSINKACVLSNGDVLFAESGSRLRRMSFNSSFLTTIDQVVLPDDPWSICVMSEEVVAVTLPYMRSVQLVSTEKNMVLANSIETTYKCYAVAFHDGFLYVSDHSANVYVYNSSGECLSLICKNMSGTKLFSNIFNMVLSNDGQYLYVADKNDGVIAVNLKTGNDIWRYSANDIGRVSDVCVDGEGSLFVCGRSSQNVLQLDKTGQKTIEVVSSASGISFPKTICFDTNRNKLVVTQEDNKTWCFHLIRSANS